MPCCALEAQHQLWHSPAGEEYASRLSLGLGNRLLSVRYGDVGLCSPEFHLMLATHIATCVQMVLSNTSTRHAQRELTWNVSSASTTCGNKYGDAVVTDQREAP